MNYNTSDLNIRLQSMLQKLQENKTELLDHLIQYISSNSLRNITALTHFLLDIMNSTSEFNLCTNVTNTTSTNNDISCEELLTGIETLNDLNFQVQKFLAAESIANASTNTHTGGDHLPNDATIDDIINNLIQRLRGAKSDSKFLAQLYTNLLLALDDFKSAVVKLIKKFVTVFLESDFLEISDKLSSIMFDVQIALGGKIDRGLIETLISEKPDTTYSTETPTASRITDKITTLGLTSRQSMSKTNEQIPSSLENIMEEVRQYLFNHSVTEFVRSGTNATNDTLEAEKYFEIILEVAVALFTSITELSQLLNGQMPDFEDDDVLTNLTAWHNLRTRTKRDAMGYMISSDRCQRQGNLINQTNFISLCSSCLHTTVLDNTFYPRYLTENICSFGTSSIPAFRDGCLFQPGLFGGRPGGICQQQELYVILLQQVPGKCMKVISHGQEIITDQWQSITYALRIGCECVVDQNSQFAKYTHFP